MDKDSRTNLVGQPILKQMMNLLPKEKFDVLVHKHESDRYYKRFTSWTHLVTILFGNFNRCDSMSEVCAGGMQTLEGKLNYFGIGTSPAKRTVGNSFQDRTNDLFRDYYYSLIDLLPHFSRSAGQKRCRLTSFGI